MGERLSADEKAAAEKRKARDRQLDKEARERQLSQAVTTLGGAASLLLAGTGVDQGSFEADIAERGLPQKRGEDAETYLKRAANICRANGLNASEVADRFTNRDGRTSSSFNVGGISSGQRDDLVDSMASVIAKFYDNQNS